MVRCAGQRAGRNAERVNGPPRVAAAATTRMSTLTRNAEVERLASNTVVACVCLCVCVCGSARLCMLSSQNLVFTCIMHDRATTLPGHHTEFTSCMVRDLGSWIDDSSALCGIVSANVSTLPSSAFSLPRPGCAPPTYEARSLGYKWRGGYREGRSFVRL